MDNQINEAKQDLKKQARELLLGLDNKAERL